MTRQEFLEKFKACELHIVCANTTERAEALRFLSEELGLTLSSLGENCKRDVNTPPYNAIILQFATETSTVWVLGASRYARSSPIYWDGMAFLADAEEKDELPMEPASEEDFEARFFALLGIKTGGERNE